MNASRARVLLFSISWKRWLSRSVPFAREWAAAESPDDKEAGNCVDLPKTVCSGENPWFLDITEPGASPKMVPFFSPQNISFKRRVGGGPVKSQG